MASSSLALQARRSLLFRRALISAKPGAATVNEDVQAFCAICPKKELLISTVQLESLLENASTYNSRGEAVAKGRDHPGGETYVLF